MGLGAITSGFYSSESAAIKKMPEPTNHLGDSAANLTVTEAPTVAATAVSNQMIEEQANGQKERTATDKQIKDAISKANSKMNRHLTRCEFSYHEETKRISIKVIDKQTEEVVREIPPEDTLEMIQKMWEMAGLLVDERR